MKSSDDGKDEFFRCRLKIVRDSAFQMGMESSFLFIFLHWLPVAARIKFKTLMLAYRTATGSAPSYFTHLWQSTSPQELWDLRVSVAPWCHHREIKRGVTWALLGSLKTSRAAAFWILCNSLVLALHFELSPTVKELMLFSRRGPDKCVCGIVSHLKWPAS